MKNKKGFTLIELLIVIGIIGILAAAVIAGVSSSRDRSRQKSALSTGRSVLMELYNCQASGGFGITTVVPTTAAYICCNAASSAIASCDAVPENRPNHTVKWPSLGTTGYVYVAPTGTLAANSYAFIIRKTGQPDIVCSVSTGKCI